MFGSKDSTMERKQAIELLRSGHEGVDEWNRKRQGCESLPDLTGANLSRCDLLEVNLRGVCLRGIFLGGSHLDRADLSEADLRDAGLQVCRLYKASLRDADLRQANLRSADVAGADLTGADLRGTSLLAVDLSPAVLRVVDPKDIRASMRRLDQLPLQDDVKQLLLEILQKLDILDDLNETAKQEVITSLNDLTKELLKFPLGTSKVKNLLHKIAPPLAADVSDGVFLEHGSPVDVR